MATAGGLAALKAHLAKSAYSEELKTLDDCRKFVEKCYPMLEVEDAHIADQDGGRWVIVCSAKYSRIEGSAGPLKAARMIFASDGDYSFEVLLKGILKGSWKGSEAPHKEISSILDTLLASSGFLVCPGIRDYESQYSEAIRFRSKNLRIWMEPFPRHDSIECLLWHKPINTRITSDSLFYNLCTNCKSLINDLNTIKARALAASPGHKEKWTEPASNRPLKYLSPASQAERLSKSSKDRKRLRKTVLKYEDPLDVELSGMQDEELMKLVQTIDDTGTEHLEAVFSEADQVTEGNGEELRQTWERDVSSRKEFFQDQLKNRKWVDSWYAKLSLISVFCIGTSSRGNRVGR